MKIYQPGDIGIYQPGDIGIHQPEDTGSGSISIYCPPMPVKRVKTGLRRTSLEECIVTITLPDRTYKFLATIPPTDIKGFGFWWIVDACQCIGIPEPFGKLIVDLPEEPVRCKGNMVMTALAMTAKAVLALANGEIWRGDCFFPDCPTKWIKFGEYLASEITATGSLMNGRLS